MVFLKRIIAAQGIVPEGYNYEMTLPGDPMIYSIKYQVGNRAVHGQLLRNKKFSSMIKCHFKARNGPKEGVVILVKFFVAPITEGVCTFKELQSEKVPAVHSFEMCDYLLSFQEMLFNVIFRSYKQIVKIDAEKFYSNNPRTVFKFMTWEHYVYFRDNGTLHPDTKGKRKTKPVGSLQPKCEENVQTPQACRTGNGTDGTILGSSSCDLPLQDTNPKVQNIPQAKRAYRKKPCEKT